MKAVKIFIGTTFGLIMLFWITRKAVASNGTVELKSVTRENYRCFVASLQMQNLEYKMPFNCEGLLYPAGENIFSYIMWAVPIDGNTSVKLGALALGKGEFKTKTSFSSLFVTTEKDSKTKIPTGVVVMRGTVEPIAFLENPPPPTPTQSPKEESDESASEISDEKQGSEQESDGEAISEPENGGLSTKDKLLSALKRAGTAALIALVAVVGIIFVISKKRKQ
ncbi:hypothetical protein KKB40_05545 [Patescibacteria group bacterium]|nr:hypothetical protein [Patescibacteria group bacterium]